MADVILVIEDEPGIVDFLERGLHGHGFAVRSALDGVRGAEMALREDVDLVVLDLMLPGRSGLDVLDEVRRAKPTLPVILLTALGEVEDRVRGLDCTGIPITRSSSSSRARLLSPSARWRWRLAPDRSWWCDLASLTSS